MKFRSKFSMMHILTGEPHHWHRRNLVLVSVLSDNRHTVIFASVVLPPSMLEAEIEQTVCAEVEFGQTGHVGGLLNTKSSVERH